MRCPRCTHPMTVINPRARICHGCGIAENDMPTERQELADALQREFER